MRSKYVSSYGLLIGAGGYKARPKGQTTTMHIKFWNRQSLSLTCPKWRQLTSIEGVVPGDAGTCAIFRMSTSVIASLLPLYENQMPVRYPLAHPIILRNIPRSTEERKAICKSDITFIPLFEEGVIRVCFEKGGHDVS